VQIVPADNGHNLPHLIRLDLVLVLLEVHELSHVRAREHAMTTPAADLLKSEGDDQLHQILEVDGANAMTNDALEESSRLHVGERSDGV
jgi:hypothetical protein